MKHRECCADWAELLAVSHPEEDLSPAEYAALEKHVAQCASCAALRERYRLTTTHLRALAAPRSLAGSTAQYPLLKADLIGNENRLEPVPAFASPKAKHKKMDRGSEAPHPFRQAVAMGGAYLVVLVLMLLSCILFLHSPGNTLTYG